MSTTSESAVRFSELLRAATWADHQRAEQAPYITELLDGRVSRDGYAALVAQHWFAYSVLEGAAAAMADDPVAGLFVTPTLTRVPALEDDLAFLLGDAWRTRVRATPATEAYCDRLREVCFDWPGGFVAHHYTRYLGDLSGGQWIRRVVERVYDLPDEQGARFYAFDALGDLTEFKDAYRARLDAAPWSPEEQHRIVDEIGIAYHHNTEVLLGMDTAG